MSLIANRVTEKDVRDFLDREGFDGRSAVIRELELVAISSPGWIQVFSFSARIRHMKSGWADWHGCVRDDERTRDERTRTEVQLFPDSEARDMRVAEWSTGMITRQRRPMSGLVAAGVGLIGLLLVALAVIAATN